MDDYYDYINSGSDSDDSGGGRFPWKLLIVLALVYEILCILAKVN